MREPPPDDVERPAHWEGIYREKSPENVSWYQPRPTPSLELIQAAGLDTDAPILDVGAGTSTLVDELMDAGYARLGVLDVSRRALEQVQDRLGPRADDVEWFVSDVTAFSSPHPWALWHDRAVLHFLVEEEERRAYRERLLESLSRGGSAVLATFGPEGPTRCSGLDCRRYGVEELSSFLGPAFQVEEHRLHDHRTPSGSVQQFLYARFRRPG